MLAQEHGKHSTVESSSQQSSVAAGTAVPELESNFAVYGCGANLLFTCTAGQALEHS